MRQERKERMQNTIRENEQLLYAIERQKEENIFSECTWEEMKANVLLFKFKS